MNLHHGSTGLQCDNVMIFPQHSYSTEAIRVLSDSGMLGATTANIAPVDSERLLTLSDLMDPAITRYSDFPIFSRTFANQEAEILLYSLLGKPIVIIFHHDSLKKGYGCLGNLSRIVDDLCPAVEWVGLEKVATRCSQIRENRSLGIEVRFFGRRFSFRNPFGHETQFNFIKREVSADRIAQVLFNSQNCSWNLNDGSLSIHSALKPNEEINVEILYKQQGRSPIESRGIAYESGVWIRRRLCEMRDMYISRLRAG
jgi:hypothetical protein